MSDPVREVLATPYVEHPGRGPVTRFWSLRMPSPRRYRRSSRFPRCISSSTCPAPYRNVAAGRERRATVIEGPFVSGVQTTWLVNENPPELRHVGLELRLHGLAAHARIPAGEVSGRVVDAAAARPVPDAVVAAEALIRADPRRPIRDLAAEVGLSTAALGRCSAATAESRRRRSPRSAGCSGSWT